MLVGQELDGARKRADEESFSGHMLCDFSFVAQHVRKLLTIGLQKITDPPDGHVQLVNAR